MWVVGVESRLCLLEIWYISLSCCCSDVGDGSGDGSHGGCGDAL